LSGKAAKAPRSFAMAHCPACQNRGPLRASFRARQTIADDLQKTPLLAHFLRLRSRPGRSSVRAHPFATVDLLP